MRTRVEKSKRFLQGGRRPLLVCLLAGVSAVAWAPLDVTGQEPIERCEAAERFLVEGRGMVVVTEPDTIDDWRTRQRIAGCRVTAAGVTVVSMAVEAGAFYDALRSAGWTRTPEPMDAPNEASLRFRSEGTDCLFNVYPWGILGTAAEIEVNTAVVPSGGESRYNVLVLCKPAMEAAPRLEPGG